VGERAAGWVEKKEKEQAGRVYKGEGKKDSSDAPSKETSPCRRDLKKKARWVTGPAVTGCRKKGEMTLSGVYRRIKKKNLARRTRLRPLSARGKE